MKKRPMSVRARRAAARYETLVQNERPEYHRQLVDNWLELATGGEVRRLWRSWMGRMPQWAQSR